MTGGCLSETSDWGDLRSLALRRPSRRPAQEPVNSATHKRFTIVREPPIAESAGDEHAAAGEPVRSVSTHAPPCQQNANPYKTKTYDTH